MHKHISNPSKQLSLIKESIRLGVHFSDLLTSEGMTYDDLIYVNSNTKSWKGRKPLNLDDLRTDKLEIPVVSFFTGCGGMDLGLEAVGYRHLAAFEFNELFCKTLRFNRPAWRVFGPPTHQGDVSNFDDVSSALSEIIRTPFEGIFVGGPPCQPFSIASNQRYSKSGENFKRTGFSHKKNGNLLFDYINIICAFKPKGFIIENVPGLRDIDSGAQLQNAIEILANAGYHVEDPIVLDAADYGVPQHRMRLFVIGFRGRGKFIHPNAVQKPIGAGSVLKGPAPNLPNSETRAHNAESILRYMHLDYGQRDQLGRVDRLNPLLPSKTVIAGGTNGGGRSHLHPECPRTLSVRECARLQTFPDDYVFLGPSARQFTQVGNAVPPVLAAQISLGLLQGCF